MRGNGAAHPASRNGGQRRHVEESEYFKLRRAKLAPYVPRLRQILLGLHEQLAHNAEENATNMGPQEPDKWTRKTIAGEGAPELWVYYSLTPSRCCLEFLFMKGYEPSSGAQDETAL